MYVFLSKKMCQTGPSYLLSGKSHDSCFFSYLFGTELKKSSIQRRGGHEDITSSILVFLFGIVHKPETD